MMRRDRDAGASSETGRDTLGRAGTFDETSPWTEHLPALLSLLDGLARHAVEDTNSASLGFLGHLSDIESRVAAANRETEAFLARLGDIDRLREQHVEDRRALDTALSEARAFGHTIAAQISESRQALQSISGSVRQMQDELVSIGRISKQIGILSINASIESARAGDAGRGFAIIAQNIRALSGDTQAITDRLRPLVEHVHSELRTHGIEGGRDSAADRSAEISTKLAEQDALLGELGEKLAKMAGEYATLIQVKFDRNRASRKSGAELEDAIRAALASAQTGDIIRQQIELIAGVILQLRDVARKGGQPEEISAKLAALMSNISGSFVMKTQHDVKRLASGQPSPRPDPEDDLPRFELF